MHRSTPDRAVAKARSGPAAASLRSSDGEGGDATSVTAAVVPRGDSRSAKGGALCIRSVGKVYDPEGDQVVALQGIDLEIASGEFCAIVGPSGCGKTTLLSILAGFDTPTSGHITMDGEILAGPGRRLSPGADRIVVFQQGALFPWKTVLWNVTCGPVLQGRLPRDRAEAGARELLARVGLEGIEDQYPGELSAGMRRRVEIVRALLNDPKVLLLDEPYRALDALTKSVMHECLLELYDLTRKTVFFVTHDLEEAIFLADRVVAMTSRPGRIKKIIPIDLPRPRDYRVVSSAHFGRLKQEAVDAIHEEALKAFEAGERELAQ